MTASELTSLESSLTRWEWFEYGAAAVVIVGVLGEAINDFTSWWPRWRIKKKLGKGSTLILIAGLACELLGLVRTSTLSNQLIADLNATAAEANERAANAEDQAAQLEDKNFRHSQRADRLWDNEKDFAAALMGKPTGTILSLMYARGDSEAWETADALKYVLRQYGWNVEHFGPTPSTPDDAEDAPMVVVGGSGTFGVTVVSRSDQSEEARAAGAALLDALDKAYMDDIGDQDDDDTLPDGSFRLLIGPIRR